MSVVSVAWVLRMERRHPLLRAFRIAGHRFRTRLKDNPAPMASGSGSGLDELLPTEIPMSESSSVPDEIDLESGHGSIAEASDGHGGGSHALDEVPDDVPDEIPLDSDEDEDANAHALVSEGEAIPDILMLTGQDRAAERVAAGRRRTRRHSAQFKAALARGAGLLSQRVARGATARSAAAAGSTALALPSVFRMGHAGDDEHDRDSLVIQTKITEQQIATQATVAGWFHGALPSTTH